MNLDFGGTGVFCLVGGFGCVYLRSREVWVGQEER